MRFSCGVCNFMICRQARRAVLSTNCFKQHFVARMAALASGPLASAKVINAKATAVPVGLDLQF